MYCSTSLAGGNSSRRCSAEYQRRDFFFLQALNFFRGVIKKIDWSQYWRREAENSVGGAEWGGVGVAEQGGGRAAGGLADGSASRDGASRVGGRVGAGNGGARLGWGRWGEVPPPGWRNPASAAFWWTAGRPRAGNESLLKSQRCRSSESLRWFCWAWLIQRWLKKTPLLGRRALNWGGAGRGCGEVGRAGRAGVVERGSCCWRGEDGGAG